MNPVVKEVEDLVVYELTDEDRKAIAKTKLQHGTGDPEDLAFHTMCIMQLAAMVSVQADVTWQEWEEYRKAHGRWEKDPNANWKNEPQPPHGRTRYIDDPICVSKAIQSYLVELNDAEIGARRRAQLKQVIPDILNTCPVKRKHLKTKTMETRSLTPAYRAAEVKREEILATVPIHNDAGDYDGSISMAKRLAAIREAAAVLQITAPEVKA